MKSSAKGGSMRMKWSLSDGVVWCGVVWCGEVRCGTSPATQQKRAGVTGPELVNYFGTTQ